MKLSLWVSFGLGLVVAVAGVALMLAAASIDLIGAHIPVGWLGEVLVGAFFFALGVWVMRGGQIAP